MERRREARRPKGDGTHLLRRVTERLRLLLPVTRLHLGAGSYRPRPFSLEPLRQLFTVRDDGQQCRQLPLQDAVTDRLHHRIIPQTVEHVCVSHLSCAGAVAELDCVLVYQVVCSKGG